MLRDHPDLGDGNIVRFDKTRKRKKPPPQPPPGGWPAWVGRLRRDDRGRVIPDLANVLIALRGEESVYLGVAFDEMLQYPIVTGSGRTRLKPSRSKARRTKWATTTSTTAGVASDVRYSEGGPGNCAPSRRVNAVEQSFHPLRDWLNSLEHDGEPQIGSWLHRCLGTPDDEYLVRSARCS